MMSAKLAIPGHLKITVFWNKGCDTIIPVDDITNKTLSHDLSYIVDVFMWPKFGNCSISTRSCHNLSFNKDLTRKTAFFEGWSWFNFNNLGLAPGSNLKFYTSLAKGLKLKVEKFLGLILMFGEVTGAKLAKKEYPSWIGWIIYHFCFFLPCKILNLCQSQRLLLWCCIKKVGMIYWE